MVVRMTHPKKEEEAKKNEKTSYCISTLTAAA
jgi:hypothetical protein